MVVFIILIVVCLAFVDFLRTNAKATARKRKVLDDHLRSMSNSREKPRSGLQVVGPRVPKTRAELRAGFASRGQSFDTPLQAAVADGDIETARRLLVGGADPNDISGFEFRSALSLTNGNREMIELLLEHGADINLKDVLDFTVLMNAASAGDMEGVKFLLAHGADPDVIKPPNYKAWMLAYMRGHKELSAYLKSLSHDDEQPSA